MKRAFYLIVLSLAALGAVSCDNSGASSLTASPGSVYILSDGGSEFVTVTTASSWTASPNADWCTVTISASGFTVSAPAYGESSARETTVTVTAGADRKTVTVKQWGLGYENLSANGTSNCYIVTSPGVYGFEATVIGNGDAGIVDNGFHASSAAITPKSAKLLWQDYYGSRNGLITSVEMSHDNSAVIFTTYPQFTPGNAVIAVYDDEDGQGNILWSWHIWMPEQRPEGLWSAMGYSVMDINLGATVNVPSDAKSYGMLYQWGRKDPLPAAATLTGNTTTAGAPLYDMDGRSVTIGYSSWSNTTSNNLLYAIQHPTVCLSNYSQYSASRDWLIPAESNDALWGNPYGHIREDNEYRNKGVKSIYDPCPAGWRVPPADVFRNFTTSGGYAWANTDGTVPDFNIYDKNGDGQKSIDDYEYGWIFNLDEGVTSYFPAAARFDGSYAMLMGSVSGLWGSYWCNSIFESAYVPYGAMSVLSFQVQDQSGNTMITASPNGGAGRADAYSVRCIKE